MKLSCHFGALIPRRTERRAVVIHLFMDLSQPFGEGLGVLVQGRQLEHGYTLSRIVTHHNCHGVRRGWSAGFGGLLLTTCQRAQKMGFLNRGGSGLRKWERGIRMAPRLTGDCCGQGRLSTILMVSTATVVTFLMRSTM